VAEFKKPFESGTLVSEGNRIRENCISDEVSSIQWMSYDEITETDMLDEQKMRILEYINEIVHHDLAFRDTN
jgi:hypothetical protein